MYELSTIVTDFPAFKVLNRLTGVEYLGNISTYNQIQYKIGIEAWLEDFIQLSWLDSKTVAESLEIWAKALTQKEELQ